MREVYLTRELLAALLERGFDTLPYSEEFATRLEEEVFVEQAVIEQCASLLPVAHHHHVVRAALRSRRRDPHGFIKSVCKVVRKKPIARLPQSWLPAHFINLQVKLCLFKRGFRFHGLCFLCTWFEGLGLRLEPLYLRVFPPAAPTHTMEAQGNIFVREFLAGAANPHP
jgi:hypothetical protein